RLPLSDMFNFEINKYIPYVVVTVILLIALIPINQFKNLRMIIATILGIFTIFIFPPLFLYMTQGFTKLTIVDIGRTVRVSVRANDTNPWKPVEEGLDGRMMLMKSLKFFQVKFMLVPEETTHPWTLPPNLQNAFEKLTSAEVKLPAQKKDSIMNYINHRLSLIQSKLNSEAACTSTVAAAKFVTILTPNIVPFKPPRQHPNTKSTTKTVAVADPLPTIENKIILHVNIEQLKAISTIVSLVKPYTRNHPLWNPETFSGHLSDESGQLSKFKKKFGEEIYDLDFVQSEGALPEITSLKSLIQPRIKEVNEESFFYEIFDSATSGADIGRTVRVSVRANDTNPWKPVEEGLDGRMMLMKSLKFFQVKFMLVPEETTHPWTLPPNLQNAFEKLTSAEVKLPAQKKDSIMNYINHRLSLIQSKLNSEAACTSTVAAAKFVTILSTMFVQKHVVYILTQD
ncbi:17158_t:CDS:2, partial [Entrophospora sp. SA101]